MALERQITTVEQFDDFIQRADIGDHIFEYIGGEIVDVPSNPQAAYIASRILGFIFVFLLKNPIGRVIGADGGFMVAGERYAPDVAYISYERQPELAQSGYNPNPPELAVEVISDESNAREFDTLMLKISNYMAVGTMVWVVYPVTKFIRVHVQGQPVQIVSKDGTLDGSDVLPGFTLAVSEIFEHK